MKRTPINKVSKKQQEINKVWRLVTTQKAEDLNHLCQWCGGSGRIDTEFNPLGGHHIIKRRFKINTKENCFICHWVTCHAEADKVELEYPDKNEIGVMYKYLGGK